MEKSKKAILLCLILAFTSPTVLAQRYGTALGIRMGNSEVSRTVGLTMQQRILDRVTLEAIIQSDLSRNTTFSLLAEKHSPIFSKRFNYYYGAGISFGNEESFVKNSVTKEIQNTYGNATFGADFIGGIELALAGAVIALDYKPNINFVGRQEFYRGQIGISARTILVKSKEQKRKQKQRQKARKASINQPKNSFSEFLRKN